MTARRVGALIATASLLAGCGFEGASSLPLPGGKGADGYRVVIEFTDVLDLVEQSSVKVNDVTVGTVTDIELDGSTAVVTVGIEDDVRLPANAVASLRQTSLLGEKFVSIGDPSEVPPQGRLADGDRIPLERTERNAEVEEVLAALSLVLNGGGLEQLQTINRELIAVTKGRNDKIKDLLRQLERFVGGLDDQKADIVRALDELDQLTTRLVAQRRTLEVALQDIPGGVEVLADQRQKLTTMLTSLDRLGEVASDVITRSKDNTVADLRALTPILDRLNAAGRDLPFALEMIVTYPFPRSVTEGIKGDYSNLFVTADIDLRTTLDNVTAGGGQPGPPELPGVPALPLPTGAPVPGRVPGAVPGTGPSAPSLPLPLSTGRGGLLGLLVTGGLR